MFTTVKIHCAIPIQPPSPLPESLATTDLLSIFRVCLFWTTV